MQASGFIQDLNMGNRAEYIGPCANFIALLVSSISLNKFSNNYEPSESKSTLWFRQVDHAVGTKYYFIPKLRAS
jgi:hypothetical protein